MHYLIFDLDLGIKVTQDVAKYPLHHVTYSATKFEVATLKGLGDAFTIQYLTLTLGSVTYSATKFEVATFICLGGDTVGRLLDWGSKGC